MNKQQTIVNTIIDKLLTTSRTRNRTDVYSYDFYRRGLDKQDTIRKEDIENACNEYLSTFCTDKLDSYPALYEIVDNSYGVYTEAGEPKEFSLDSIRHISITWCAKD